MAEWTEMTSGGFFVRAWESRRVGRFPTLGLIQISRNHGLGKRRDGWHLDRKAVRKEERSIPHISPLSTPPPPPTFSCLWWGGLESPPSPSLGHRSRAGFYENQIKEGPLPGGIMRSAFYRIFTHNRIFRIFPNLPPCTTSPNLNQKNIDVSRRQRHT